MKKIWQFKLDGEEQTVILAKNPINNKLSLQVNGKNPREDKGLNSFFPPYKGYPFQIGKRSGAIVASVDKSKVHYDLTIEHFSITTGQYKLEGENKLKWVGSLSLIPAIIFSIWLASLVEGAAASIALIVCGFILSYLIIYSILGLFTSPIQEFTGNIDYQNLAKVGVTPTEQAPPPTWKDKVASAVTVAKNVGATLLEDVTQGQPMATVTNNQIAPPESENLSPTVRVSESRSDDTAAVFGGAAAVAGVAFVGYKLLKGLSGKGNQTLPSSGSRTSSTVPPSYTPPSRPAPRPVSTVSSVPKNAPATKPAPRKVRESCHICNGTGMTEKRCGNCRDGLIGGGLMEAGECPQCNGTGYVKEECFYCNGKGYIEVEK